MKIDRLFFEKFEEKIRENNFIAASVSAGQWDRVIDYVNREVFDKPDEFYNLDKLRKAAAVDRRLMSAGKAATLSRNSRILQTPSAKFALARTAERFPLPGRSNGENEHG